MKSQTHSQPIRREFLFDSGAFFPSCHASSLLALKNGDLLVAYFAGTQEGAADVGIYLSRQTHGRWLIPARVAKVCESAHWNPVLFFCDQGIRMVFKVGNAICDWISYTMISRDGGITWSQPHPYGGTHASCGPVRSKPLPLADGRMLAPNSRESSSDHWRPFVDVSENGGESFEKYADIPINTERKGESNFLPGAGAIQPVLWEDERGIHALLRTTGGRIFRSDFLYGENTWSEAQPTALPCNNSAIDLLRNGTTLYLALNPVGENWGRRTPLALYRSEDDGDTFTPWIILDSTQSDPLTDKPAELSYPSLFVKDDMLYATYTFCRRQIAICAVNTG